MLNKKQIKEAYFEAKMDTLSKYPEMAKFFDLIERRKSSVNSAVETPLKSDNKEDLFVDDH